MSRVLVTGGSGFVGSATIAALVAAGRPVTAALRRPCGSLPGSVRQVLIGDIGPETDWQEALEDVSRVIHLAARVHVMRDTDPDPESAFDRVNGQGTRRLAEAMAPGTPLILVSSIKVNGERTPRDQGFTGDQPPAPEDPYGRSKLKAEQVALAVLGASAIILRPPLVYGPGVGGNLATLLRAVRRGVPLPLGAIDNRRSLIARTNLVSAIVTALDQPGLGGRPFTLSDGSEFSTPELVRAMAIALGRSPRLLPVPVGLLRGAARLLGRGAALERLTGSLLVDGSAFRRATGWQPVISPEAAFAEMARGYA